MVRHRLIYFLSLHISTVLGLSFMPINHLQAKAFFCSLQSPVRSSFRQKCPLVSPWFCWPATEAGTTMLILPFFRSPLTAHTSFTPPIMLSLISSPNNYEDGCIVLEGIGVREPVGWSPSFFMLFLQLFVAVFGCDGTIS